MTFGNWKNNSEIQGAINNNNKEGNNGNSPGQNIYIEEEDP